MITLKVEASFGVLVKPNSIVERGDRIGVDPNFEEWIVAPVAGIVREVTFDDDEHCFIVKLEPFT